MSELKVKSKKYNDKDELIVENFEEEVSKTVEDSSAPVVKALEGQDLKVKTIESDEANWSLDLEFVSPDSNLEVEDIYNRVEKIGNILYVVFNIKLTNTSETNYSGYQFGYANINLPTEIADKIVDLEGKKVSEVATTDNCYIASTHCFQKASVTFSSIPAQNIFGGLQNRTIANQMDIYLLSQSSQVINAGTSLYLSGRIFLTLL